jgi:hypothetical protein
MASTGWGINLNEITLYEGNIPIAVTYTVTSQRSGEVRHRWPRNVLIKRLLVRRVEGGFESVSGPRIAARLITQNSLSAN